jgi:hypothetical protein
VREKREKGEVEVWLEKKKNGRGRREGLWG